MRDRIERLEAEIAFHRKVLATLNAVHAIKETMPSPCPYVVGNTTKYCSLTPLTLTDKEREAIREAIWGYSENDDDDECASIAATLRALLERLSPPAT
jgi:hypothetical protein